MRRELLHEIAEAIADDVAFTYGLKGNELRIKKAILGFMYEDDSLTRYAIRKALVDIKEDLGVNDAPWDDTEWLSPQYELDGYHDDV